MWAELLIIIVKVVAVVAAWVGAAAVITLAERRFSGFIQDRLGPNRVGPQGLLQPIADISKLVFKEELLIAKGDKIVFLLSPIIIAVPAFMVFAVIPFGDRIIIGGREIALHITNLDFGVLYIFALASLGVYGIVLGSWASNNKYALFGGLRASAQMISYELTLGMSVIGVILVAESLRLPDIVAHQTNMMWGVLPRWNVFTQPIAFFLFVISAFAETNRLPFDLAEAEQELVAGFHTEYSGMKFALFFLSEYMNLVTAAALITTLFFGGWHLPYIENIAMPDMLLQILQVFAFAAKTGFWVVVFIWVRWTLPRFKYNQLMTLGWKILLPVAILNVLVTGIIVAYFN